MKYRTVGTLHFDPDENSVYKTTRVVELDEYIVVYRRKQLKKGQWARESTQSIFAKDVVVMTELYSTFEKQEGAMHNYKKK